MMPNGWQVRTMRDVLEKVADSVLVDPKKMYQEIGIRSHGKGIFHKEPILGSALGDKRVFWVQPNVFVVNIVFAWEQAVACTTSREQGMIASHRFPMFRPKEGLCDVDYLAYYFKTRRGKALLELASPGGAGRNKTLGQKEFFDISIPLPTIDSQKKIAQIISTWDKAIEVAEMLLEKNKEQKKALMQILLTGKERLNGFSGYWTEVTLGDLGSTYSGLSGKTKEDFGEGELFIPYINIFNNSKVDVTCFEKVTVGMREKQNLCKYGDIFFTTSSETPEEVGMSSVLLDDVGKLYLNSFCFGYRLNDFKTLHPNYARYLLRAGAVRKELNELAQGSTRFNISKKGLMKIKLSLPPIDEQLAISIIIENSENQVSLLEKQLAHLKQEKNSLAQQLFTGKRRVKAEASNTNKIVG